MCCQSALPITIFAAGNGSTASAIHSNSGHKAPPAKRIQPFTHPGVHQLAKSVYLRDVFFSTMPMQFRLLLLLPLAAFLLNTTSGCGSQAPDDEKVVPKDSMAAKLQLINDKILKDPNNLDLYIERSKHYIQVKNLELALADVNRVLSRDSSKAEYLSAGVDVYFFTNQTRRANDLLTRLVQLYPENTDGLLRLAQMKHYLKKYDEEFALLDRVLRIDENNAQAYFMKGMAFKESGDTAKAMSSMQTAVEQDPDYYNAWIQLGLIAAADKNPLAAQYYLNALKVKPQSQEAFYHLGMFYQNTQQYNPALEAYNTLLQLNPNHFDAHFNLGYLHTVELNDPTKGMEYFNLCVKDNPKEPRGYYGLGYCYKEKGDIANAEAMFKKALEVDPEYNNAVLELNELDRIKKSGK
jgi:tetratricopeptide (TPR) repeat protein